jgi:nitrite reductase (NO-forming)
MIVDLAYDQPGTYALVNHDYAAIFTGAATIWVAGLPYPVINETATALGVVQGAVDTGMYAGVLGNPYDSIPPYGAQSIHHPAKNVHCMCSDAVAQAQADAGAVKLWEAIPAILAAAGA